jgi:hypothetical protein
MFMMRIEFDLASVCFWEERYTPGSICLCAYSRSMSFRTTGNWVQALSCA